MPARKPPIIGRSYPGIGGPWRVKAIHGAADELRWLEMAHPSGGTAMVFLTDAHKWLDLSGRRQGGPKP